MIDFVLDIETLGINPGAPILSIGAVCGESAFYEVIHPTEGTADNQTVQWWRTTPSAVARKHVFSDMNERRPLKDALVNFVEYIKENNPDRFWGCSPDFDYKHIEYWLKHYGMEVPWKFYQLRDVRTIRDFLTRDEVEMLTEQHIEHDNKHIAVYDAYLEAQIVKHCRQRFQGQGL